jgi:hypothetical protein
MEDWHLTPALLDRLLARDRDDDENRALLHLLAVCPECRTGRAASSAWRSWL